MLLYGCLTADKFTCVTFLDNNLQILFCLFSLSSMRTHVKILDKCEFKKKKIDNPIISLHTQTCSSSTNAITFENSANIVVRIIVRTRAEY